MAEPGQPTAMDTSDEGREALIERRANRIMKIFGQITECLEDDEVARIKQMLSQVQDLCRNKSVEEKPIPDLNKIYVDYLLMVEFRAGISVNLIKQSIRAFLMIEDDVEGLGRKVNDMFLEMILTEHPSLALDIQLSDESLRIYFELLKEGYEESKHIRLMVVGMCGVGKTSLIRRLCNKDSIDDVESTEVIDIVLDTCEILENGDWKISTDDEIDRVFKVRLRDMLQKHRTSREVEQQQPPEPEVPLNHQNVPQVEIQSQNTDTAIEDQGTIPNTNYEQFYRVMNEKKQDKEYFETNYEPIAAPRQEKEEIVRRPTVSIWDFAGQSVYYSTHHFFLNARSIYILVLDLSKDLQEEVQEDKTSEKHQDLLLGNKDEKYTCLEAFKFWMKSIFIYTKQKKQQSTDSYKYKPKIILVGTFGDMVSEKLNGESLDKYKEDYFHKALLPFKHNLQILELVHGKKFLISNKDQSNDVFLEIKKEIFLIASDMPFMKEKIPARFIPLEREIFIKKKEKRQTMMLQDLTQVNKDTEYPQSDKKQIKVFLEFQHAFGSILYFNTDKLDEMIILTPQWIINAFKALVSHKKNIDPKNVKVVDDFKKRGKLNLDFIVSLLEQKGFSEHSEQIVEYMEYLDVIVKPVCFADDGIEKADVPPGQEKKLYFLDSSMKKETKDEDFYVMPCLLPSIPNKGDLEKYFKQGETVIHTPILCFFIKSGFLPPFVVHRLLATCLKEMPIKELGGRTILFNGIGSFSLTNDRYLTIWADENIVYLKVCFSQTIDKEDIFVFCRRLRVRLEDLILQLFNFHGRTNFDNENKGDLFDCRIKCPKCKSQVPYDLKQKDNDSDYVNGLLNVTHLRKNKVAECPICNEFSGQEALDFWFEVVQIKSDKQLQVKAAESSPEDEAQLADMAEYIFDVTTLAQNLNIPEKEVTRIRKDFDACSEKTVVYQILYHWMMRNECWQVLLDAIPTDWDIDSTLLQIIKNEENIGIKKEVDSQIEKINLGEGGEVNELCLANLVRCIGQEYWTLGILLEIPETEMQQMRLNSNNKCATHITEILQHWKKSGNGLRSLITAMVKSKCNMNKIVKCCNGSQQ